MIPSEVQKFRTMYLSQEVSKYYLGLGHLVFTSTICILVVGYSISQIHNVSWLELLTVPITFLYANIAEYFGHKGPMHHKRKFLSLIFKRHTMQHHRYFTDHAMECDSFMDYKMILFPPILILFFFGFFALPVGVLLYVTLSKNVGFLFVATAIGYFLNYEWLHLAYHQKEDSWVYSIPFLRALRKHHLKHHDPAIMARSNFNITYPICDTIFRTKA